MRVLIQRVREARVKIDGNTHSAIGPGLLVLVGIEAEDTPQDAEWLAGKVSRLRVFDDTVGTMNIDVTEAGGDILVVSQFTLYASTRKGNRPSYIRAAGEGVALPLYRHFISLLEEAVGKNVESGIFGADMLVELINDGPVTIWIDSKNRE